MKILPFPSPSSFALLSVMTEEDLKELGVVSLGHRKKLAVALQIPLRNAPAPPVSAPMPDVSKFAQPLSFTPVHAPTSKSITPAKIKQHKLEEEPGKKLKRGRSTASKDEEPPTKRLKEKRASKEDDGGEVGEKKERIIYQHKKPANETDALQIQLVDMALRVMHVQRPSISIYLLAFLTLSQSETSRRLRSPSSRRRAVFILTFPKNSTTRSRPR